MLKQRIITGIVLVGLLLLVIYALPRPLFTVVVGIVTLLGAWEWTALSNIYETHKRVIYLALTAVLFYVITLLPIHKSIVLLSTVSIVWWLLATVGIFRFQKQPAAFKRKKDVLNGVGFLVLIPFWFSLVILNSGTAVYKSAEPILLFVIALVALADTAAYFVGKKWGKHKLASQVSPGKSWEGLIGAIVAVTIVVVPLSKLLGVTALSIVDLLLLGLVTVITALIGDLFESMIKRIAGVKDSGTLLPGHGGILDRIDAYTAAVPIFMAVYLLLAG